MKDRVPTKPGRVKLTKADGSSEYVTMERADEPTQVGTPLNKGTLLSDATAAALGLTGDATVNDGLAKLAKATKVGDILTTTRTDLSDNWLLCNGDSVSKTAYAQLAIASLSAFCGTAPYQLTNAVRTSGDSISAGDVFYYNGITAVLNRRTIFYTTDPLESATWHESQMLGDAYNNFDARSFFCYNGTWIVVGMSRASSFAWRTNDLAGEWTSSTLKSASSTGEAGINRVYCANGTWIACGFQGSSNYGYVYVSVNDGRTWTNVQINSTTYSIVHDVIYVNGQWVACGAQSGTSGVVYWTADPTGVWNKKVVSTNGYFESIGYNKGLFIVNNRGQLHTSATPDGGWTTRTFQMAGTAKRINSIGSTDVILTDATSSCRLNLNTFDVSTVIHTGSIASGTPKLMGSCVYADDAYLAVSQDGKFISSDYLQLPSITTDMSYTYIKAKE